MYKEQLIGIGVPVGILGFEYLNKAMELYTPTFLMGNILSQVADEFNTTPSRAERAIRHAFKKVEPNMNMKEFIARYKYEFDNQKPVNAVTVDTSEGFTLNTFIGALKSFADGYGNFTVVSIRRENFGHYEVHVEYHGAQACITLKAEEGKTYAKAM